MDDSSKPPYEINFSEMSNVVVVELVGNLAAREVARDQDYVRGMTSRLTEKGHRSFLVNMEGVQAIGDGGIAILTWIYFGMRDVGGHLVLSGARPKVRKLLRVMNLESMFEFVDDTETGLRVLSRATRSSQ